MRHVFLVHSHVCHRVAEAVVRHDGLDPAHCVLLAPRGYAPDRTALRQLSVDYTWKPESFPRSHAMWACRRRLRSLDRLLAQATAGEPFHFYTPQTSQRYMQLILNSPACTGFSFLEEGLNSYLTREQIDRTHPPARRHGRDALGYRGRIGTCAFFERGHARAYGVTDEAFPGMEGRVVLDDVFPRLAGDHSAVTDVLVFDALAVHRRVEAQSVLTAVGRLLETLHADGVRRLHFKFHPAQHDAGETRALEAVLADHPPLEARRLGPEVCLESLAATRPGARFYVNASSVGLYAARLGCTARTWSHWVAECEPQFAAYVASLPAAFHAAVPPLAAHGAGRAARPPPGAEGS